MMTALGYFFSEALTSLRRRWQSALLAVLTIAAGLFVVGLFLIANVNLQRVVDRWTRATELSVYFSDDADQAQVRAVDDLLALSGLVEERRFVSKTDAFEQFRQDFPELAATADALERNPFPASFEVRLTGQGRNANQAVEMLATTLAGTPGVADVQYDSRWLARLNAAIRLVRGLGMLVVLILAMAASLTVANVVRLAAHARRDEIEIMELVGAPIGYIRGPFIAEGFLQGGAGALAAILALWAVFAAGRARYGHLATEGLGLGSLTFLPAELWLVLLAGGMLLGSVGGIVVARSVR